MLRKGDAENYMLLFTSKSELSIIGVRTTTNNPQSHGSLSRRVQSGHILAQQTLKVMCRSGNINEASTQLRHFIVWIDCEY